MSEEMKNNGRNINYQVESIKRQKAFAWAKYYEVLGNESDNANVIINLIQHGGIQRNEEGKLDRPNTLPPHITQEFYEMAERLNKQFTCPCCFELVTKETIHLPWCGHILCKNCYEELKDNIPLASGRKPKCPMCRKLI
jgi:hypothetical protein